MYGVCTVRTAPLSYVTVTQINVGRYDDDDENDEDDEALEESAHEANDARRKRKMLTMRHL